MGKYDKDRFQKELAIRYCLARGAVPFLEVVVRGTADLSDAVEVLTDIDVLGLLNAGDGGLRRTIFDCKTSNKMSAVNRAFWACGVKDYTGCDDAYVLLKAKAVSNHRISALGMGVDLHDEDSFRDLGLSVDAGFPADEFYQSKIDGWNLVFDTYSKTKWAENLFDLSRNQAPLSRSPWSAFRKILAELRSVRGQFDPDKNAHVAIFLDVLASVLVLWATMGRDIRRFYEPSMTKAAFETILKYYIWGGRESYQIRQQMRERLPNQNGSQTAELPAWDLLVDFAGLQVSAPQYLLGCAHVCREFSIRELSSRSESYDRRLAGALTQNNRVRQLSVTLSDYLVVAGGLPNDFARRIQSLILADPTK